jgi:hypothetical protein
MRIEAGKNCKKKGENEEKKLKFMSWSLDLAQCLDPELDSVNPD